MFISSLEGLPLWLQKCREGCVHFVRRPLWTKKNMSGCVHISSRRSAFVDVKAWLRSCAFLISQICLCGYKSMADDVCISRFTVLPLSVDIKA